MARHPDTRTYAQIPLWSAPRISTSQLTTLDLCTGAGGEALGIEGAGFASVGAVENDHAACATLRLNRPHWRVMEDDIRSVNGRDFRGVDLIAAGVPCPPFSIAGKQLGESDERDLFPEALRIVQDARPAAILLENVPGFATAKFLDYRTHLIEELSRIGYVADWRLVNASDLGVPQLRPRFILVALRKRYASGFRWPEAPASVTTVGQSIGDLMASRAGLELSAGASEPTALHQHWLVGQRNMEVQTLGRRVRKRRGESMVWTRWGWQMSRLIAISRSMVIPGSPFAWRHGCKLSQMTGNLPVGRRRHTVKLGTRSHLLLLWR